MGGIPIRMVHSTEIPCKKASTKNKEYEYLFVSEMQVLTEVMYTALIMMFFCMSDTKVIMFHLY